MIKAAVAVLHSCLQKLVSSCKKVMSFRRNGVTEKSLILYGPSFRAGQLDRAMDGRGRWNKSHAPP